MNEGDETDHPSACFEPLRPSDSDPSQTEQNTCFRTPSEDIFGTANYPFKPFIPEWIPVIQGLLLLAGIHFGLSRGYLALGELIKDSRSRAMAMILPSLFALFVVNVLAKLYMG